MGRADASPPSLWRVAIRAACLALLASWWCAPAADAAWAPDVEAARAWALTRAGGVSFAVRTPQRTWSFRATDSVPAASTLKVMLLVAYLDRRGVRSRPLRSADRALLAPMIRRSDNASATRVRDLVGHAGLRRVARRAGMRRFAVHPVWGLSRVDAGDQSRFLLALESLLAPRHRAYALELLRTIAPAQRWGIAQVRPRGWTLHFKGGWGSGTGAVDHQVALLRRGAERVAVAIMTTGNRDHADGKRTLRGVAARLLRGLDAAPPPPGGRARARALNISARAHERREGWRGQAVLSSRSAWWVRKTPCGSQAALTAASFCALSPNAAAMRAAPSSPRKFG
jgi:hypothetical protein